MDGGGCGVSLYEMNHQMHVKTTRVVRCNRKDKAAPTRTDEAPNVPAQIIGFAQTESVLRSVVWVLNMLSFRPYGFGSRRPAQRETGDVGNRKKTVLSEAVP